MADDTLPIGEEHQPPDMGKHGDINLEATIIFKISAPRNIRLDMTFDIWIIIPLVQGFWPQKTRLYLVENRYQVI